VGDEEVGRCGIIHGGIPKGGYTYPLGGAAHGITTASSPDLAVGEECWKTDLDTTVGEGSRSLDCVADRSLLEAVAVAWKIHWLRDILPIASWVPNYSENPVTQQRLSHV
jgi:hypothetical protein